MDWIESVCHKMNMMERMVSIDLGPEPTGETDLDGDVSLSVNDDTDFQSEGEGGHHQEREVAETVEERSVSSLFTRSYASLALH